MKAYCDMMALEYQTRYRKPITVGEALRLLMRIENKRGEHLNIKG
jgi:hypothetical protein